MKALPPLLFLLLLLPLASQSPVRSPEETLLEILGEDLAALLSGPEGEDPPSLPQESWSRFLSTRQQQQQHPPLRTASGAPRPSTDHAWLHFFHDFMTTQKKFRGRTKKMAQQGCFGIKLDRIGTLSGLGC